MQVDWEICSAYYIGHPTLIWVTSYRHPTLIWVTTYGHPTLIWVTTYGHPTLIWVTTYGHPTWIWVTIGMRILKKKLKMRMKTNFFTILTKCTVILRSFYIIYDEISFHLTVPFRDPCFNQFTWVLPTKLVFVHH